MKLAITDIYKKYGTKEILKGVSFQMDNGLYGLLGPRQSKVRIPAG